MEKEQEPLSTSKDKTSVTFSLINCGKGIAVPCSRQGHATIKHGKFVYVHAGRVPSVEKGRRNFVDDFWRYDLEKQMWEEVKTGPDSRLPSARHNHSMVEHKGIIWMFGGSGFDGEYFNDLYCFDTASNSWDLVPSEGAPSKRHGHSACILKGNMYIFGGKSDPRTREYYNDIHCFNVETKSWKTIEVSGSAPSPRCWHSCVLLDEVMIVFGGYYGWDGKEKYFNDCFAAALGQDSASWAKLRPGGEAPFPRNRAVAVTIPEVQVGSGTLQESFKRVFLHGGNYFNPKTRDSRFFSDSFILYLPSAWITSVTSSKPAKRKKGTEPQWLQLPNKMLSKTIARSHHTAVLLEDQDTAATHIWMFGGERKRKRFNDVTLARLQEDRVV